MTRRARTGAVGGILLLALFAWGLARASREAPPPLIGRPVPAFALEGLTGDTVRLADYAGRVLLVNFWASWCLACAAEHPVLEYAHERYGARGAQLLGIVFEDTRKSALAWLQARGGVHWPQGLDAGSRVAIDYGLRGVPETFFVGRDGRVRYHHVGPLTAALVDSLVPALLAEPLVPRAPSARTTEGR